jgi:hypothetical protein
VNPVAVECERGVTEEEKRRGFDASLMTSCLGWLSRRLLFGQYEVPVDEVLTLTNQLRSVDLYQVIDCYEAEAAGAAFLRGDIRDARDAPNAIADPQIALETHRAAGPHAPRKHDGGQKAAALGMSVCAKDSGGRCRLRQTEVKQTRRNVAGFCRSLREIEGRAEPSNEIGGDDVRTRLLPADPGPETRDVEILRVNRQGSPFLRPSQLATSDACSARERRRSCVALQ